jgi:hypothetical protein
LSSSYYNKVLLKRVELCLKGANESLEKAKIALNLKDYASSILHSRRACQHYPITSAGSALLHATRAPHSGIKYFDTIFEKAGVPKLGIQFFSVLDLQYIGKRKAGNILHNLELLLDIYDFFYDKLRTNKKTHTSFAEERSSALTTAHLYLTNGYYRDLVWYVRRWAEGFLDDIRKVECKPNPWSREAMTIKDFEKNSVYTSNFKVAYLKCMELDNVNKTQAVNKLRNASIMVERIADLCSHVSSNPELQAIFN